MERDAHKSRSFDDAAQWDKEQQLSMTPDERLEIARVLRIRAYGADVPDVRESERQGHLPPGPASGSCSGASSTAEET
jgi:hypothetical protein